MWMDQLLARLSTFGAVRQVFRQRGALEVRELASLVDRFQMTEVTSALDQTVMLNFDLIMVGEVLGWSGMFGLRRSEGSGSEAG